MNYLTVQKELYILYDDVGGICYLSDEILAEIIYVLSPGEKITSRGKIGEYYAFAGGAVVILLTASELEYFFHEKEVMLFYLRHGVPDDKAEIYMNLVKDDIAKKVKTGV